MSADRLREAAQALRHQPTTPYDEALAQWLDAVAEKQKPTEPYGRRSHGWTAAREANAVADLILEVPA